MAPGASNHNDRPYQKLRSYNKYQVLLDFLILFLIILKKLLMAENYYFLFKFAAHFYAAWTAAAVGRPHQSPVLPCSVPQTGVRGPLLQ
jgi:hypothetical protein